MTMSRARKLAPTCTRAHSAPRSVIIPAMPTDPDMGLAGARLACIDLDGEH